MSDFTDSVAREHQLMFRTPVGRSVGLCCNSFKCDYITPDREDITKWDEKSIRWYERKHIAEITLALFKEEVLKQIEDEAVGYLYSIDYSDGLLDAGNIVLRKGS